MSRPPIPQPNYLFGIQLSIILTVISLKAQELVLLSIRNINEVILSFTPAAMLISALLFIVLFKISKMLYSEIISLGIAVGLSSALSGVLIPLVMSSEEGLMQTIKAFAEIKNIKLAAYVLMFLLPIYIGIKYRRIDDPINYVQKLVIIIISAVGIICCFITDILACKIVYYTHVELLGPIIAIIIAGIVYSLICTGLQYGKWHGRYRTIYLADMSDENEYQKYKVRYNGALFMFLCLYAVALFSD